MRVAIIHYWLVGMRGGEKVLESLCRLYPGAHIYTHCLDLDKLSPFLQKQEIRTTFIAKLPFAKKLYKHYLPLMPLALEQLDLRNYDLIIACESGPSKGVLCRAEVPLICYCHTPMRYLWDFYHEYLNHASWISRLAMRPIFHYLRAWDQLSAKRVSKVLSNSQTVAGRVKRWWQLDATVVYPPVELERFKPLNPQVNQQTAPQNQLAEPYFLCFSQLTEYKRIDLAILAANTLKFKLIIAGDGEELASLQKLAGSTVEFLGRIADTQVPDLYAKCQALIFPGEEDFGLVPLEVMACGRPVIAYGRGGALETVVSEKTGVFFDAQTVESLCAAIKHFQTLELKQEDMLEQAAKFNEARFHQEFLAAVNPYLPPQISDYANLN